MKKHLSLFLLILTSTVMHSTHAMSYKVLHHGPTVPGDTYVLGGVVKRDVCTMGFFSIIDNDKPKLVLLLQNPTAGITDFNVYLAELLLHVQNAFDITVSKACFGVPGNTAPDRKRIVSPHFSFVVDADAICAATPLQQVAVLNDFELIGFGLDHLEAHQVCHLGGPAPQPHASRLVIGAGNGVGSCLMVKQQPVPLGLCFVDCPVQSALERGFADYFNRVNAEKGLHNFSWGYALGLTGGLVALYEYLATVREYGKTAQVYDQVKDIFEHRADDARCRDAVELYLGLYATLIRNGAYMALAYGGVYITNTVAVEYPELLCDAAFYQALCNGNNVWLNDMLHNIPFYVVTDPYVDVRGAAAYVIQHFPSLIFK